VVVDFKNDVLTLGEVPLVEHHAKVSILVPDPLDTFGKLLDPWFVRAGVAKENVFASENLPEMSLWRHTFLPISVFSNRPLLEPSARLFGRNIVPWKCFDLSRL
jgi:hypothetical protein